MSIPTRDTTQNNNQINNQINNTVDEETIELPSINRFPSTGVMPLIMTEETYRSNVVEKFLDRECVPLEPALIESEESEFQDNFQNGGMSQSEDEPSESIREVSIVRDFIGVVEIDYKLGVIEAEVYRSFSLDAETYHAGDLVFLLGYDPKRMVLRTRKRLMS